MNRWTVMAFKLALTALVIGFVAWQLRGALADANLAELRPDPLLTALGLLAFCGYLLSHALLWWQLTRAHATALPLRATLAIWCYSILGKYVPGKALLWGIRYVYYRRQAANFNSAALLRCFVLEYFGGVAAGFGLALLATAALPTTLAPRVLRGGALVVLAASLIIMHPAVLGRLERMLGRGLRIEPAPSRIGAGRTAALLLAYGISWLILGFAVFLLARAVEPTLTWSDYPYVTAAYTIAGLVGFLALFAPSGIGVREGVLIAALNPIMPLDSAAVVALLARLVATVGEILLAAGAAGFDAGVRVLNAARARSGSAP